MHYLYKITNICNNKVYIGQSNKETERWRQHKYSAKHKNPKQYIHRAMATYGIYNFIYEVIAMCKTQEDANAIEMFLIKQYSSRDKALGYNVAPGGNGLGSGINNPNYGRKQPLDEIERRASKLRGQKRSEEQKQKIRKTLTGVKHTLERRLNQSNAHKGKPLSKEHRYSLSKFHKEHPNSGQFQIGHPAQETAYKKGFVPWNKGKTYSFPKGNARRGTTKFSNTQIDEMVRLRDTGLFYINIAKQFGCSQSTVIKLIKGKIK